MTDIEDSVAYEIVPRPEGGWNVARPAAERLRRYRAARVALVAGGETPVPLEGGARVVLHLVPEGALRGATRVDVKQFANSPGELKPLAAGGWNHGFNADGFFTYSPRADGKASGYLQLFRDGSVETTSTNLFGDRNGQIFLVSLSFEKDVLEAVSSYVRLMAKLSILPPYHGLISLTGAGEARMGVDTSRHWFDQGSQFNHDPLLLPPFVIADPEPHLATLMQPVFDLTWQAAGWPGSHYYDANGKRTR